MLVLTTAQARLPGPQGHLQLKGGELVTLQDPAAVKFTSAVVAIDKATGKLVYDEVFPEGKRPFFHAIHGDPRTGEFEVISADRTLRFSRP